MPNSKTIEIRVDQHSWPSSKVPSDISGLPKFWQANIFFAMLHTAIWTRPPTYTGLHLNDFWAWLRYGRAISTNHSGLRLREEFEELDAHQKTILSDDFGIGFTTYFLVDNLGFTGFANTLHILKLFPELFKINQRPKRGPGKTPDFLASDKFGNINILECKGTQSSRKYLGTSTAAGIAQKKNLGSLRLINHCLVAGLFVPKFSDPNDALLLLKDPPPDVLEGFDEIPPNDLKTSISQISLAKHFSLMGLTTTANALSSAHLKNRESLPENSIDEMKPLLENSNSRRDLFSITLPKRLSKDGRSILFPDQNISFSMTLNPERLKFLRGLQLYENFLNFHQSTIEKQWEFSIEDETYKMTSPFGFELFLEFGKQRVIKPTTSEM